MVQGPAGVFFAAQPATMQSGLAATLRERTRALHAQAERSGIINDILRGRVTRVGYALLLRNLLQVYNRMEAELERLSGRPGVRAFARSEVYRAKALESDLLAISGTDWACSLPLLPAAKQYEQRIAAAAAGDGARLIGHAYVRYLGDLSGGLILRRMLPSMLGLRRDQLSFFDFPEIADADAFKRSFRAALDQSAMEVADPESVVLEAMAAFELNITLSDAVKSAARLRLL
jgi:heme oxygenase (biliverdin-producing, ferredoxin)